MSASDDAAPADSGPSEGDPAAVDDYGTPFEGKSFGGEFVWAQAETYTSKILRVRAGQKVEVSTRGRRDMFAMLTGGRAILEVITGDEVDPVELMPASPISISPDHEYRLVAVTEVELFTIYAPL
jgi:hypothetical protein